MPVRGERDHVRRDGHRQDEEDADRHRACDERGRIPSPTLTTGRNRPCPAEP
jgi:hypothetical protein